MGLFERIAEERIREAMDRGEFEDLPGRGKPLAFEDDSLVPEDLKMAYKVLKNSGCVPPELEMRNEIQGLISLISTMEEGALKTERLKELNYRLLRFNIAMKRPLNTGDLPEYAEKVADRIKGR